MYKDLEGGSVMYFMIHSHHSPGPSEDNYDKP